jgi:hypothetical protein
MNQINETTQFESMPNIEFEAIKASAEILIETQNSCYRFCVIDAHQRHGYLSGGSLGQRAQKAILLGTIDKQRKSYTTDPKGLKTEARAIFYIETESGMKHLVTSMITRLKRVKNTGEQKYLF